MYDVIIAGAGPAGSLCAERLAQKGCQVLVLEEKDTPGNKLSCTGLIGLECAAVFGIDDEVIISKARSARIFSPSGQSLRIFREQAQACIIDRPAFDISMTKRALLAGAEIRCGSRVTGISQTPDGVRFTFLNGGNTMQESGRYGVIACGYAPRLTEEAGMGRPADFVAGAQAVVDIADLEEVEVFAGNIAPGFFAWLVPTVPGKARAGLMARKNIGERMQTWLDRLAAEKRITLDEQPVIHYGMIPLASLHRTRVERILAVGDAAGQVKPLSGGGIYYGLLGAAAAAATLAEALQNREQYDCILDKYERRWKKVFGQEIRNGRRIRRAYEKLGTRWLERIFTAAQRSGLPEAVEKAPDIAFDWHAQSFKRALVYQRFMVPRSLIKTFFK